MCQKGSRTYKLAVMTCRCLHSQEPQYIANRLTPASEVASCLRLRSANRHLLIIPRCRLYTYGRRTFPVAGPTVWNSLRDELRDPTLGFDSFGQFLFGLYWCDQGMIRGLLNSMRYISLYTFCLCLLTDSSGSAPSPSAVQVSGTTFLLTSATFILLRLSLSAKR